MSLSDNRPWVDDRGVTHNPNPTSTGWAHPDFQERLADERNSDVANLTGDARLPGAVVDPEAQLRLAAKTSAKMMRAAHQGQQALNKARLFDCDAAPAEPISHRDGVSIQILKRLASQVKKLEGLPLGGDESELDRHTRIAQILSMMSKQQSIMEHQVAKAVEISLRAQQSSAKLMHEIKKHSDKMALAKDMDMDAADVEKIADA